MNLLKKNTGLILVVLLGLIPLIPLLHLGLPITHDGQDHVARIANFYKGLTDGIWFPRWAENLNWGYGHPILMFLYPFPSYLASLFHFFGFGFVDSVKLTFASAYVTSGVFMYLWAREAFGEYVGIAGALFYMYAPYRFVDFYVRGAIGEHMAFVFLPLCLYFLLRYFKEIKKGWQSFNLIGVSISTFLLLLSHNAISLMFLPFIVFYIFYLFCAYRNLQKTIFSFIFLFFGFTLASFFLLPAFLEGKYTLRDIVTGDEYSKRFINPINLIYSPWNYGGSGEFSIQLGFLQILGIVLLPLTFFRLSSLKSAKKNESFPIVCNFIFSAVNFSAVINFKFFVWHFHYTQKISISLEIFKSFGVYYFYNLCFRSLYFQKRMAKKDRAFCNYCHNIFYKFPFLAGKRISSKS